MSNRKEINQKTDFNNWSISYLTEIFQCGRCKKRNTVSSNNNNNTANNQSPIKYQKCIYCGNPNYVK